MILFEDDVSGLLTIFPDYHYSQLSCNKPLYVMGTSVKRTPTVGPCLCLLQLGYSMRNKHHYIRGIHKAGPKDAHLRKS